VTYDPLHDVFETLEPPPGGLYELRRRVRGEGTPRRAWLGGLAVAAVAAALWVVATPPVIDPGDIQATQLACGDAALAGLLCDTPEQGASVAPGHQHRLALEAVSTGSDRVLLYRVASNSEPLEAAQIRRVERSVE